MNNRIISWSIRCFYIYNNDIATYVRAHILSFAPCISDLRIINAFKQLPYFGRHISVAFYKEIFSSIFKFIAGRYHSFSSKARHAELASPWNSLPQQACQYYETIQFFPFSSFSSRHFSNLDPGKDSTNAQKLYPGPNLTTHSRDEDPIHLPSFRACPSATGKWP